MRIFLARHGETALNVAHRLHGRLNAKLTKRGHAQARGIGAVLRNEGVEQIYASDLGRVRQTVQRIRELCKSDVRFVASLRERDMGTWTGRKISDIKRRFPRKYPKWSYENQLFSPPAGESIVDVKHRVSRFLDLMLQDMNRDVAVVSHSVICRVLFELITEYPIQSVAQMKVPNDVVHLVEKLPTCTRVFHFHDGGKWSKGICTSDQ